MELKVWVEGIQRIVCGVTDVTTCQDVVYALAHATGKTGRFTLMERWRNSERLLAPQEHPLKILLKWGEYASDVQFILQRTALQPKGDLVRPEVAKAAPPGSRPPPPLPGCPQRVGPKAVPDPPSAAPQSPPQGRDIKKSLTFSGGHSPHLEGIGGTPMLHPAEARKEEPRRYREREEVTQGPPSPLEPHVAPVSEALHGSEERTASPPLKGPCESPLLDNSLNGEDVGGPEGDINSNLIPSLLTRPPHKSSIAFNKVLRESGSPKRITPGESPSPIRTEGDKTPGMKQPLTTGSSPSNANNNHHPTEEVVLDGYYRDLVKLVNDQREKICAQQVDLTKFEAEIAFKEGRWKEEESRLAYIQEEIQRLERDPEKQVQNIDMKLLPQLEEQLKVAKKAESSSKQEIEDIEKKIAACDHQLGQLHSRIQAIQESLREEESAQRREQQQQEQEALQREVDKLQVAVGQAEEQAEEMQKVSHQLALEMSEAEDRLEEKRREVDALKHAMREVNLEALSMSPAEEAKAPSETKTGNHKGGSNRRMVGSPRQLETAVPTSKNPHGVWV